MSKKRTLFIKHFLWLNITLQLVLFPNLSFSEFIVSHHYHPKFGETLQSIFRDIIGLNMCIRSNKSLIARNKKYNTHVRDWNLLAGKKLYLEYPSAFADQDLISHHRDRRKALYYDPKGIHKRINYKAKKGEGLKWILEKKLGFKKHLITQQYKCTVKENPHISNWNNLNGKSFVLDYHTKFTNDRPPRKPASKVQAAPMSQLDIARKFGNWKDEKKKKIPKEDLVSEDQVPKSRTGKQNYSLTAFYAFSLGTFTETLESTGTTVESDQNSPFTIGIASTFRPLKKNHFYTGSVYGSRLNGAQTNNNTSISIPWEWGLNAYWNRPVKFNKFTFFFGLDHESFSSFNTADQASGATIDTVTNNISYLTLGLTRSFDILDRPWFFKASFSSSVRSSTSSSTTEAFSGNKFILFLSVPFAEEFFVNGFYKQHVLSGTTELSITRLGIGFGYRFF